MNTALVLLALTAFVALVVRGLERNHARDRSAVGTAPGSVALDRDAERVAVDLHAGAAEVGTGRVLARRPSVSAPRPHRPHRTRVA